MNTHVCFQCGNSFKRRKKSDRIEKFCTHMCYSLSKKGRPSWNKGLPSPWAGANGFKKGHHASPETEFKKGENTRQKNTRWKGGVYVSTPGYVMILAPEHPRKNVHQRVPEQVLVSERYLGRYLTSEEVVHHINQVKADNRPENLFVFPSKREHARHHMNLLLGKEPPKTSNLL